MIKTIQPDWNAPSAVRAFSTTRMGGVSDGEFGELNLATHVPTTAECDSCHNSNAWIPAAVDHSTFIDNCISCHDGVTASELLAWMEPYRRLLPGLTTAFWMANLIAAGVLAQAVLAKFGRNLRPWPEFLAMELPGWMAVAAAATLAAAMVLPDPAGAYSMAIAFAACFAFLLQGLAVVHAFNRKIEGGRILLAIFYLLVFGPVWPALLVVLLGAVEQFAGFRRGWKVAADG